MKQLTRTLFCLGLGAAGVFAQDATVLTTGLLNPQKVILTGRGNLLVSETDKPANSGRISFIDRKGARRTFIEGLPSGLSAPNLEPIGPTGLFLDERGRQLFVVIGEGDSARAGSAPGSTVGNPAGASSPIYSSVLRVRLNRPIDEVAGSFTLKKEDHQALADGKDVRISNLGDDAIVDLVYDFHDVTPDPNTIYRHSDPYGVIMHPRMPNMLFVVDAGQNALRSINLETGKHKIVTRFAPIRNAAGVIPPVSDAVPDSIRVYGRQFLVTLLTGFPFTPGQSRVLTVDPETGEVGPFISGLSSAIDVELRPNGQFLVLQFSNNMLANQPGALLKYDTPQGSVATGGLITPTSMALDNETNELFVTEYGTGNLKVIQLAR